MSSNGVFDTFDADEIIQGSPTEITVGLWSGNTGSLATFFSSSAQASSSLSGQYYWDVYQSNPNIASSVPIPAIQFSVAYGNRNGGGAPTLAQSNAATLSTTAIYSQYRNLLLEPDDTQFTFLNNYNSDHIYVINIARSQLRGELDPGNWSLQLSGSNGIHTFIDDSGQTLSPTLGRGGSIFNVVSGSLTGASGSTIVASGSATWGGYGLVYPTLGMMILNPNAISESVGFAAGGLAISPAPFAPVTGSNTAHQYNHAGLYNSIVLGGSFQARSAETISSTYYFVNVSPSDFNYSNNPTFYNANDGSLVISDFVNAPVTYVTTVGLYNDSNELLAVAKLTRAKKKSFTSAISVVARIDF